MTLYNKIQGRSMDRLAALSDGIFGVAMTLLLLVLCVAAGTASSGAHSFTSAAVNREGGFTTTPALALVASTQPATNAARSARDLRNIR